MKAHSPAIASTTVVSKTIEVNGLNIFYREAGDSKAPKVLLLHGFPSSSHQYRNLIPDENESGEKLPKQASQFVAQKHSVDEDDA